MKVAAVNETSASDRNAAILAALAGRGLEIINAGMLVAVDSISDHALRAAFAARAATL